MLNAELYARGHFTAALWQSDDSRQARVNIQVLANGLQPLGQIGRRRPRPSRNAKRGQRTGDRSREADRAQHAQAPFFDDTGLAVGDLEGASR
jgi:hypothetical protein